MRTTLEIIIAVQACEPVTEEELRLALIAMSNINHFIEYNFQRLIQTVLEGKPTAKMQAEFSNGTIERMFQARKRPPDEWLGSSDMPGTPENRRQMELSKKMFKAAMGRDL